MARDLSICLSTVEYVWSLNNQKFKWFKEHAIAYLVQQMHKNGVNERIIRHILEISTHRKFVAYMKKDPETCLHYNLSCLFIHLGDILPFFGDVSMIIV